jgi:hypothetical protein
MDNGVVDWGHNVLSTDPGLVSTNNGLFWLKANSVARGAAGPSLVPPVSFFEKVARSVTDVGAFQYSNALASDERVLDPSSSTGAEYWGHY